jgi:hypothetical protein
VTGCAPVDDNRRDCRTYAGAAQEHHRDRPPRARKTPPELVADIIDRGVALCGGGALLRGIDKLLTKSLGIPAYLVDNPLTCVVEGTVRGLNMYNLLRRNLPRV